MGKSIPITVIIPTMNRPETLERTLETYASGIAVPDQIIIVDQTQNDETRKKVEVLTQKYSGEYIYQATPSLTVARNRGLLQAKNEILVISDDDIDVYNDTIKNVYEIMQEPEVALIAGLDDNTGHSKTNIGYLLGTKSFLKRKIGHVTKSVLGRYPDYVTGEVTTEWAMGYFFICRKSCLDKWDMKWDERLISYAYAEDLDFSYRYCKKAFSSGMRCILNDKIHVRHMTSTEYRIPSRRTTYMYAIHRRYIANKNKWGSKTAILWCDLWKIVERIVKHEQPKDLIKAIIEAKKLEKNQFSNMEKIIENIQ